MSICSVATNPVVEETPKEEQAPEEPAKEDEKEMTLQEGCKKKNKIFSFFSGCFGGKSQVVEAKENDEADKPAEEEPSKDEPAEDKPVEGEEKEWIWSSFFQYYPRKNHTVFTVLVKCFTWYLYVNRIVIADFE